MSKKILHWLTDQLQADRSDSNVGEEASLWFMRNLVDSENDEFLDGGVYRLEERAVPIFIEELLFRISEPA